MAIPRLPIFHKMSLRKKILLPFFLILFFFGSSATVVSVLLISQALSRTSDQRLNALESVVLREINKQETLLEAFAGLIQSSSGFLEERNDREISRLLEDHLYQTLLAAEISVSFFPADRRRLFPYPEIGELFDQAYRSGRSRFRLITGSGLQTSLAVAAPLYDSGSNEQLVLLQSPINREFLQKLAEPFHAHIHLLSRQGQSLLSDSTAQFQLNLSPADIQTVLAGEKIFRSRSAPLTHRFMVFAAPLGTTDVMIMGLEMPMTDLAILVKTMATGSVLAIFLCLLLGGYIYYRLIHQIMSPVKELMTAAQAVSEGNLDQQIGYQGDDDFGNLGKIFNNMLIRLKDLYERKVAQEKELALAQEELRYKRLLEGKTREIEKTNREMKTHVKELSALFQLNKAMISTLDVGLLFDRMTQVLKDFLRCDEMVLFLYNQEMDALEVRKSIGFQDDILKDLVLPLDEGLAGRAGREQKLLYEPDLSAETSMATYQGRASLRGAAVAVPLVIKKRLKGVLAIHKARIDSFNETETSMIQAAANQLAIALENVQLYEQARNLSNTDELTHLANRRYFQEVILRELSQASRYQGNFSLVMADIDHFKCYNDIHGHLRGDQVLKKVAAILLQNTRGIDLVARFGGEEFVILLPKTDKVGALVATEKLRLCIAEESFAGEEESQPGGTLTLSLGVAEYPTDGKDIFELLELADRAMYRAKEEGRNRVYVWQGE